VRRQDEVQLQGGLAPLRVELGDERPVAGRADAHVQVWRPAGIAPGDARLVAKAARAVGGLGRTVLAVVLAGGVRGPPIEPRRRPPPTSPPPSRGSRGSSRSPRSRRASSPPWRTTRTSVRRASTVADWTIATLSRAITARQVSPVEVTRECLARVGKLDPTIR